MFVLDIRYGYILVCIYVSVFWRCIVRSGKRGIAVETRVSNRGQSGKGPSDDSVLGSDINCDMSIRELVSQSNAVLYESNYDICILNKSVSMTTL